MRLMNVGMSTITGQPSTHVARLHARHRCASSIARRSVNPRLTSSKVPDRSCASRVGISWRPMVSRSRFDSGLAAHPAPRQDVARGRPLGLAVRAEPIGQLVEVDAVSVELGTVDAGEAHRSRRPSPGTRRTCLCRPP